MRVWPWPVRTRWSVASSPIRRGDVAMLARMLGGSSGSARWMAAWRPPARLVPAQPTISLWSASGSSPNDRGRLGVLVQLALEAARHRRERAVAVDPGRGRRDRLAELAREATAAIAGHGVAGVRGRADVRRGGRGHAACSSTAASAPKSEPSAARGGRPAGTRTTRPPAASTSCASGSPAVTAITSAPRSRACARGRERLGGRPAVGHGHHEVTGSDPPGQRRGAIDDGRRAQRHRATAPRPGCRRWPSRPER